MKLKNLVYEVLTELREYSDDGYITEAFVEQLIDVYRAKYIQQEYSKRGKTNQASIQSFNLTLTPVDTSTLSSVKLGTVILESEVLPDLVSLSRKSGILRVRTIDLVKGDIHFMSSERAKLSSYSKFSVLNAFIEANNKLYVIGNLPSSAMIRNIHVDAVLAHPSEISNYSGMDRLAGEELSDYPIDLGLWSYVKEEVINNVVLSYKVPVDSDNNAIDDKEATNNSQTRQSGARQQQRQQSQ